MPDDPLCDLPAYTGMGTCPECGHHADSCGCCEPVLRTKRGAAYVTDDGEEVPSHALYRYDCQCGKRRHQGACWYADEGRAHRSYERRMSVADVAASTAKGEQ